MNNYYDYLSHRQTRENALDRIADSVFPYSLYSPESFPDEWVTQMAFAYRQGLLSEDEYQRYLTHAYTYEKEKERSLRE